MSDTRRSFDHDEHRMRAYLLGELPESESSDLESRLFESDADYDRLLDAQYDLIDAYAHGTLGASEREAVERRLLADPEGRRKAALANALLARERAQSGRPAPVSRSFGAAWPRLAAAAVFLCAAGGAVWLAIDNARLRRELDARLTAPAGIGQPAPSPATTVADASMPSIAEFALTARVPRSDQRARTIEIPSAARLVRARLELNEPVSALRIAVERAGDGRIWAQAHTGAREEGTIVLWLPAEILTPGDYEILIWREREAADTLVAVYPFTMALH